MNSKLCVLVLMLVSLPVWFLVSGCELQADSGSGDSVSVSSTNGTTIVSEGSDDHIEYRFNSQGL